MLPVSVFVSHVTAICWLYETWDWSKRATVANVARPVFGRVMLTWAFAGVVADSVIALSHRREYMESKMTEYDRRCAACSSYATPCYRFWARRSWILGNRNEQGLEALSAVVHGGAKTFNVVHNVEQFLKLWKFLRSNFDGRNVWFAHFHLFLFTMDAWYPAFAMEGSSNCQNVGWFNHASKHIKHSNMFTTWGSSLLQNSWLVQWSRQSCTDLNRRCLHQQFDVDWRRCNLRGHDIGHSWNKWASSVERTTRTTTERDIAVDSKGINDPKMSIGFRQTNHGIHRLHQGQIRKERTDRFEQQLACLFHLCTGTAADQERWDQH